MSADANYLILTLISRQLNRQSLYADATAFIGAGTVILGNSRIQDYARIDGCAIITDNSVIRDNAVVDGWAIVGSNAQVLDNAKIREYSRIYYGSVISGNAVIKGSASVFYSAVSGYALLKDYASVWGATLEDNIILGGDAEHFGICNQGTYLQIFNLGNRGCDGLTDHSLNTDINPAFANFTDQGMGITTGLEDNPEDQDKPYSININNQTGAVVIEQTYLSETLKKVKIIDLSGRVLLEKNTGDSEITFSLNNLGNRIFIMLVETKYNSFSEKIVRVQYIEK